jgi:hypothetical protein
MLQTSNIIRTGVLIFLSSPLGEAFGTLSSLGAT